MALAPKICVGLAGSVGVGKSALLKTLLDNEFDLASDAQRRPTQDLEFEHVNIFKCSSASTRATCYRSSGHLVDMEHIGCNTPGHLGESYSNLSGRAAFVDCPGDLFFVNTILKGIMLAEGVLILSQPTNGFEDFPTVDALAGAHLMGKSIVVVQIIKSNADLDKIKGHVKEIKKCMKQLKISPDDVPIVEVHTSAALKGTGAVCRRVIDMMARPRGELAASSSSSQAPAAFMLIARSCVVDPVGDEEVAAVAEAAAAGDAMTFATIIGRVEQGIVSAGDEVEVRPGILMRGDDGNKNVFCPITLKVVSVLAVRQNSEEEEEEVEGVGLVALRASATIVNVDENAKRRQHRLVGAVLGGDGGTGGHVLGHPGSLPSVYDALKVDVLLIPRMCEPYTQQIYDPLPPLEAGEQLQLIIGTMSTCGWVKQVKEASAGRNKRTTILVTGLSPPTWARYRESILICRRFTLSWHLIGSGAILGGRALAHKDLL